MSTLLLVDRWQVLKFICLLLTPAQSKLHVTLAFSILDAKVNGRPRWHLRELVIESGVGRLPINGNHAVSRSDSSPVGITVGINLNDFWLTSKVRRGGEARPCYRHCLVDHTQTHQPEKVVVWNLLHSGNIVAEKLRKALAGDRLCCLLDTLGVGK